METPPTLESSGSRASGRSGDGRDPTVLVADGDGVRVAYPERGSTTRAEGLDGRRPTCLAVDPGDPRRVYCGTRDDGVLRSEDGGRTWRTIGLAGQRITSVATSPAVDGLVWAGSEPSHVWSSGDGGASWSRTAALDTLPSSSSWAFPPRPETHHVRWIACHPRDGGRLWVAIEAGALVTTADGGSTWEDRVAGGPVDTHELAVHPDRPERLHVAAGDGAFGSPDGGRTWTRTAAGLDIGYMRSVALDPGDPDAVLISGASGPRSAYVAGRSDGRVYRRVADGSWTRIGGLWADPPSTIAPLLRPGRESGELWAADERGIHRSTDGGRTWSQAVPLDPPPRTIDAFAIG